MMPEGILHISRQKASEYQHIRERHWLLCSVWLFQATDLLLCEIGYWTKLATGLIQLDCSENSKEYGEGLTSSSGGSPERQHIGLYADTRE